MTVHDDNRVEIKNSIDLLKEDDEIYEIRIVSPEKKVLKVCKSSNNEVLLDTALQFNQNANIYISLNPIVGQNTGSTKAISDSDIKVRKWLMIDLDVTTKGQVNGETLFSRVEQHSIVISALLNEYGFCDPYIFCSGYGIHLLYPIYFPNNEESTQLIKEFLKSLSQYFSTEDVFIDPVNYNASRLCRLYGTMNMKRKCIVNNEYRKSYLISEPINKELVEKENLQAFVSSYPVHGKPNDNTIDVEKWLLANNIGISSKSRWKGIANRFVLDICPFNNNHQNQSAFVIQFDNGAISAGCLHNSCSGKNWKDLRELYQGKREEKRKESSPSSILIHLSEQANFYKDDLEEGYALVKIDNHRELYKIKSQKFKKWLTFIYYKETGKAPSTEAMSQALSVIETKALFEGESVTINRRVARKDDRFYYDIGDKEWSVVEIYPGGWQVLNNAPVLFYRNKNMKSQCIPINKGDVHLIDKHFRFKNIDDLFLFKVYVIHCLIPQIPHLISIFHGEKGSSKTTSVRKTKRIVDPSSRDLLSMPKGKNELALILANNYLCAMDNLEKLQSEQSNLLAMASTGGGVSKRTLYTDDDETILDFKRCIVLNGINIVATKPDLLDRSILLELKRIPPKDRKDEESIWKEFDEDLPIIFSGILSVLGDAMEIYPTLNLQELPRMADASKWGYAIAQAMGETGERFLKVYRGNQFETNRETIADHPVAAAMVALVRTHNHYESSVSELLNILEKIAVEEKINVNSRLWPRASNILSRRLKEVKSNLSEVGVEFEFSNSKNSTRIKVTGKLNID